MSTKAVVHKCPSCNANMKAHWQRLSKGLVGSLVKFREKVIEKKMNKVHIQNDMNFTKCEFTNFQKLRYHGLVHRYIDPSSKENEAGCWILTRRGNKFCKNQISIPVNVQTFRNKISAKSPELVFISDVLKGNDLPYWDKKDDFGFDFADVMEVEEIKFDEKGQGEMVFDAPDKESKKEEGKIPRELCGFYIGCEVSIVVKSDSDVG